MVLALKEWFKKDLITGKISAIHRSKGAIDRSWPLCLSPAVAVYNGSGIIDLAEYFSCQVPN